MKKTVALILSLMMMVSCLPMAAFAADWTAGPTLSLSSTAVDSDNNFTVTLNLNASSAYKIGGYTLNLIYDPDLVTLDTTQGTNGVDIPTGMKLDMAMVTPSALITVGGESCTVCTLVGSAFMNYPESAASQDVVFHFTVNDESGKGGAAIFTLATDIGDHFALADDTGNNTLPLPAADSIKTTVYIPITSVNLTENLPAPTKNGTPKTTLTTDNANVTATVEWYNGTTKLAEGATFAADTAYRAKVILTPAENYAFSANPALTGSVALAGSTEALSFSADGDTYAAEYTFPKTPAKELTGITAAPKNPTAGLTYEHGDTVNPSDITVTASYDDGTSADVASAATFTYQTGSALTKGDTSVTVNYGGKTATLGLTVTAKTLTVSVADIDAVSYNGTQQTPEPSVSGTPSVTLTKGTDYTVSYGANKNAGTGSVTVSPVDDSNYTFTAVTKSFTIAKAEVTVTADKVSKVYGETDPALTYTVSPALYGTDAFSGALSRQTGEDIGFYDILQNTLTAGDNYDITFVGTQKFEIKKTPAQVTARPTANNWTYDGDNHDLLNDKGTADTSMEYALGENDTTAPETFSATLAQQTNAGTYYVWYRAAADTNHSASDAVCVTVTVSKATPNVSAPAAISGLSYTGSAQALVTAGSTDGGAMEYNLGTATAPNGTGWSTAISQGTDAGTYYVWYRVSGGDNYEDYPASTAAAGPIAVMIDPADWPNKTVSDSARYSASGTVDLTDLIAPGGTVGDITVTDTNSIFDTPAPSVTGKTLSFKLVDDQAKADKTATVTIPVTGATNYNDYDITATITLLDKLTQTIAFDAATLAKTTVTYGDALTVNAVVSVGDGAVTYSSADTSIADFADPTSGVVTINKATPAGTTVKLTATAGETETYAPATADFELTINPKDVTITGLSASDKTYDGSTTAVVTGTAVVSGALDGDTVTVTAGTAAFADANAGAGKTVTFSGYSLSGADAANYNLTAQPADVTANIDPLAVTVTADAQTVTYGTAITEGQTTPSPALISGDAIDTVVLTPSGKDVTDAGTITPSAAVIKDGSGNDVTANYALTYAAGVLTINPLAITITADDQTVDYGTPITEGLVTPTPALVTGDAIDSVTLTPSGTDATTSGTITPSAAVIKNGGNDVTANYTITYANGALVINKVNQDAATGLGATAPTAAAATDGTITGVNDTMEYKASGDTSYTPVPTGATSLTDLAAGTYQVRYKADANHNAGTAADVVVPAAGDTTYTVTVNTAAGGSAGASMTSGIPTGTTITLVATPDAGYLFKDWTVTPSTVTITSDQFTMGTENVTVTPAFEKAITVDPSAASMTKGTTKDLTYTISSLITGATPTWASDNTAVATVDATGKVTAVAAGTAKITATITIGGQTYSDACTVNVRSGGSSSGGGGGGGTTASNAVKLPASTAGLHGKIAASTTSAKAGDKVTLTETPDEGYQADTPKVTDANGNSVPVTRNADGTYSFTMPATAVTIEPAFVQTAAPSDARFVDVPADAYYADAVDWAVDKGITNGTDDTHFSPNAPCTRAQVVTFLWRAAGQPAAAGSANPFVDVQEGAYYYDAVLWASGLGITKGTDDTHFSPNDTVTRGQIVTFMYRAAGSPAATGDNPFTDVSADAYYYDAVLWAASQGITTGMTATTFAPNDACLRAQIVTFMYRAAQMI